MLRWQGDSAEAKEELAYFMSTFDEENKSLREQIDELNQETYSLQAQLDALRAASREAKGGEGFFRPGEEQELYPSERSDLLRSILSQVQTRFEKDSRADVLIQSMLDANPRGGECRKTVATVRAVLTGGGRPAPQAAHQGGRLPAPAQRQKRQRPQSNGHPGADQDQQQRMKFRTHDVPPPLPAGRRGSAAPPPPA